MYDTLIGNVRILDGTGGPEYRASVALADGRIAAIGALPGARPGATPLDDLRQKIRPAPQERLARMVDINEERTAQILRKWAAQEVAA